MKIEFPGEIAPAEDGGLSVRALVDGETVPCHFTMEALQDVDPDLTMEDAQTQFQASKEDLQIIAEKKIRSGEIVDGKVTVYSADVRS